MNTTLTRAMTYIADLDSCAQDMFNTLQNIIYDSEIKESLVTSKKELFEKAEESISQYLRIQGFN